MAPPLRVSPFLKLLLVRPLRLQPRGVVLLGLALLCGHVTGVHAVKDGVGDINAVVVIELAERSRIQLVLSSLYHLFLQSRVIAVALKSKAGTHTRCPPLIQVV